MKIRRTPWIPVGPLLLAAVCAAWLAGAGPESDNAAGHEKPDRLINIVAERFTFVPSQIKLRQGEVVELRIRSLDTNHGFLIRDAAVNVIVPKRGKGEARVLFRAQKKGLFPFVCSKACGAGHTMMRGSILVE
jgi:heme/copper-type cytochrome/quinol oxidase subunit 2